MTNPSRPFIQRPVATSLLAAAVLLIGLFAYRLLPVSSLPEVDFPTIQVVTLYPGASPKEVAASVTGPLARQLGRMPGLDRISATSSAGMSAITLRFNLSLALDSAEQEVQAAINAATPGLPPGLSQPPVYRKVNPADTPVMTLALTSATMPLRRIRALADTQLLPKLSQVPGVGQVSLGGGHQPAIVVQANPSALATRGLTLEDVRQAIVNANQSQAKGALNGPLKTSTIAANDQLGTPAQFRQLIIRHHAGAVVRLGQVAHVATGSQDARRAAWSGSQPAIIVSIRRQPGANVVDVVNSIRQLLPQLLATLPPSVNISTLTDRTHTIRASVHDVQLELIFAVILVVLVIFGFLRTAAATAIPAIVVPLSLIGTFAAMYAAGFSVNNLTLMALIIATGFMVDDTIVMIENIARHIEAGKASKTAALDGSREIAFTVISLTLSVVAVLIPLLFMGGIVGRLFREFALTLAAAMLISAVVSLTLTPMLCARLLRHVPASKRAYELRKHGTWFERLTGLYARWLERVLAHQHATLAIVAATIAVTIVLYVVIPKGLFPAQDTGEIQAVTLAPPTVSFARMAQRQQALAKIIAHDPAVAHVASFVGVDTTNATLNSGRFLIALKPLSERDRVDEVIQRLQAQARKVHGIRLFMRPVPALAIADQTSRGHYQFALTDADPTALRDWVPRLVARLERDPHLADVSSNLQYGGLEAYVKINRHLASRYGITAADVGNALDNAFAQRHITTLLSAANQRRVILEIKPAFTSVAAALDDIHLRANTRATGHGQPPLVPLSAIATISQRAAPLSLTRINQLPAAIVSFNLRDGASLGRAIAAVARARHSLHMPADMQLHWQGAASAFTRSLGGQLWLILATIITVYIVLGVLYESFIHPLTILSTLPAAGIGALLALIVAGFELNAISIIGIILVIGIVQKNAILMIDFALDAQRTQGLVPRAAIVQACRLRFRPIIMTTCAALLGALPLMLGWGMGAELRHPLGVAVVGGLLVSQVLTLFTTPVIYLAFAHGMQRIHGLAHDAHSA